MLFGFVYLTADISALSQSLDSTKIYISAVRYTNVNGIVCLTMYINNSLSR